MHDIKRAFSKTVEHIVDQRQVAIPPAWLPLVGRGESRTENGVSVLQTGPGRCVADAAVSIVKQARTKVAVSSFLLADSVSSTLY